MSGRTAGGRISVTYKAGTVKNRTRLESLEMKESSNFLDNETLLSQACFGFLKNRTIIFDYPGFIA